jgi:hypothetical protein
MERKGASSTAVVTTKEVKASLGKRAQTLTQEEEKALRMRHGAGAPDLKAPLPRAAAGNQELEDELLLIEMKLLKAMKARTGASAPTAATVSPAAPGAAAKAKIIRSLRNKR